MSDEFKEKMVVLVDALTELAQMLMITFKERTPEKPDPDSYDRIGVI